jgi:pimeloyl-ACP methyl ester carboxylesterase
MRVGRVELAVVQAGVGGRPLLIVHGFGGAKEDFTDILPTLADRGWHAVTFDLRGHGESDRPAGEEHYSFEVYVRDCIDLANTLGWGPFVLLGHSMGGMIAQLLVLEHPQRVEGLILMSTSPGPPEGVIDRAAVDRAIGVIKKYGIDEFHRRSRALADPLASPSHHRLISERPGYAEFCERKALTASADMRTSMLVQMAEQSDRLGLLGHVKVPTLVIDGEEDTAMVVQGERIARAIPNARHVVIKNAGHSPQFENAGEWWAALDDFLSRI